MGGEDQIITLKDVYREVVALGARVGVVDERLAAAARLDADHEARLRALERWRYALPASLVVGGGGLATAVGTLIGH